MDENDSSDEDAQEFGSKDWRDNGSGDEQDDSNSTEDDEYQEESDFGNDSSSDVENGDDDVENEIVANNMSWKENLAQKARESFLARHSESKNIMRLVYGAYTSSEKVQ